MRLLPKAKRQAMFAVYAFCRVVDDIADGDLPAGVKLSQLQGWREEIDRLYAGTPRHPVAQALREPVTAFDLARDDFLAIIDGMEMDARGPIVAPPMAELAALLRAGRRRGRVALRPHLRRARAPTASRLPTPSAKPCSSPTSCAISPRMPASGDSICRGNCWRSMA